MRRIKSKEEIAAELGVSPADVSEPEVFVPTPEMIEKAKALDKWLQANTKDSKEAVLVLEMVKLLYQMKYGHITGSTLVSDELEGLDAKSFMGSKGEA